MFIRNQNLKRIFFYLLATVVMISCTDENGRKGRPLIKDFTIVDDSKGCGENLYYILGENSCIAACEEGTKVGTQTEIDEILNDDSVDEDIADQIREILESSKGACVPDIVPIVRPTNQVYIQKDFCSCLNGKPDIISNCGSFCAANPTNQPTLFGKVKVGPDIELNDLKTLHGWCTKEIDDGAESPPSCFLHVYNDRNSENLSITIPSGSNTFTANLSTLPYRTQYIAKIVVLYGTEVAAESDTFQIYRTEQKDDDAIPTGPLSLSDVTQYNCVTRSGRVSGGDNLYEGAARVHFYYPSDNTPVPQPQGNNFLICHDTNLYGDRDSSLYERLDALNPAFKLWNQSDIRFADVDGSGRIDINELLEKRLKEEFNDPRTVNIFGLFSWANRPNAGTTPPNLGFYMQPWINKTTGRGFCPKQAEYNGSDNLFKLLKEYVGVDTEAVYLAEKDPESIGTIDGTTQQAPQDVLIIREKVLKQVWFYRENGRNYTPDEITVNQKTILFYYPIRPGSDPHIQQSDQRLYTVRAPESIGMGGTTTGIPTVVRPPDKRFGCIPALD